MRKITEGQFALGALVSITLWIVAVLPLISSWQAYQFAHPPERSNPKNPSTQTSNASHNESEPHKSLWERTTEDPTAFFTAWVAVFTCVLASSTIGLWVVTWRSSVRQSNDMQASIEAAKRSADIAERALTELEAPIVGIKIVEAGLNWDRTKRTFTVGTLKYKFVNYGRTAATIFEICDDMRSVKIGEGFPLPLKSLRGPPLPYGVFVPPNGETEPFNFPIWAPMLGLAEPPDATRVIVPFFLGTVRYGDIFGNLYTMGFCFMFDDVGNRFIEAGGPEHSYCRKERGIYRPPGIT